MLVYLVEREDHIFAWLKHSGRRLGALALLAMLVRALVPDGYMLAEAQTPNGRFLVVQLCDDHRSVAQVIDLDTGKLIDPSTLPQQSPEKPDNTSPCVFAMSAQMASPPEGVAPIVFRHSLGADFSISVPVVPGRGIAAPPPPSTGPPTLI